MPIAIKLCSDPYTSYCRTNRCHGRKSRRPKVRICHRALWAHPYP